jgi:O-6-methylguanine DNA methyltransferase
MSDPIELSSMRLADATRVRQAGITMAGSGTLADVREQMRNLIERCRHHAWIAHDKSGCVIALVGIESVDAASSRAQLHLIADPANLPTALWPPILRKAFIELDLYRLEMALTAASGWDPVMLASFGWQREGILRQAKLDPQTLRHHDVEMYSILRPDMAWFPTVFVPFSRGVFAITADGSSIRATDFVRFGTPFRMARQRESAERLGLLDAAGNLANRRQINGLFAGHPFMPHENQPDLLFEAARQAAAYFAGQRSTFELPLDIGQGSTFQQQVWRTLEEIPYGTTWTYEELAGHLPAGLEKEAARRMSRAVGSACGANPLPLFLPCHRVIGKDGKLVGFNSGLEVKEYLLALEMMGLIEC